MSDYVVVRCHGLKRYLLSKEKILELASSQSLLEFVDKLTNTFYAEKIRGIPLVPEAFQRVFANEFYKRVDFLYGISPPNLAEFLKNYMRKFEIELILSSLIEKLHGTYTIMEQIPTLDVFDLNLNEIFTQKTFEEAFEILIKHPPFNEISATNRELILKNKSMLLLESELKRIYYTKLLESIKKLPKASQAIIMEVTGIELDITNVMIALSNYLYGYPPDTIEKSLIPISYKIPIETLRKLMTTKDRETIRTYLFQYRDIINILLEKGETAAYIYTQRLIRKKLEKIRIEFAMNVAFVFYYVKMAEFEYRDLTSCVFGIYHHMPFDKLKENLILVE